MATHDEVQRLTRVYQNYQNSGKAERSWSEANKGNQAIVQERMSFIARLLRDADFFPLKDRYILDIGCGTGKVLASFCQWGASPDNLYGVDLLQDRISIAKKRYPFLHLQRCNAERLSFYDSTFDIILLFTVFTSILDKTMAQRVAIEADRTLRPGGSIIWYDFRYDNPRNPHVRGMKQRAIENLFPDYELHLRTMTLLPPLARRLGSATPLLYPLLAQIPLLRTHYLGLLIKR